LREATRGMFIRLQPGLGPCPLGYEPHDGRLRRLTRSPITALTSADGRHTSVPVFGVYLVSVRPAASRAQISVADLLASGALDVRCAACPALPRRLDSCHPSGCGRRVKARAATAKRLGLDSADVAETLVQRGYSITPPHSDRESEADCWNCGNC